MWGVKELQNSTRNPNFWMKSIIFNFTPLKSAFFEKKTHPKRLFLDVWKVYYGDVFVDDTGIVKTLCTSLKLQLFPTILKLK